MSEQELTKQAKQINKQFKHQILDPIKDPEKRKKAEQLLKDFYGYLDPSEN